MEQRQRRLALKPDSSFFRKIVIGVVGARAVAADLEGRGHKIVELERGSTDTKLWKDVKRKRVRIPDLLCVHCGCRVESRAKTKTELSMSHSPTDAERAWDYGMVGNDCIALPVCEAAAESYWSAGDLSEGRSYWHERNRVKWKTRQHVNYFSVKTFRSAGYKEKGTKGPTEGSETTIVWQGTFSKRSGKVEAVERDRVTIRRDSDGRRQTWRVSEGLTVFVGVGETIREGQILAGAVKPLKRSELKCPRSLPQDHIRNLLSSRERTQRFTGVKLARVRGDGGFKAEIRELIQDTEEDIYIRLEGCSYLAAVCGDSAGSVFTEHLRSPDPQTQLETVIALGEAGTVEAIDLLSSILEDANQPYFLRSAAAWSLGQCGDERAVSRLVRAFADVDLSIREEALSGLVALGGPGIPILLDNLQGTENDIAAGCADALRQQQPLPREVLEKVATEVKSGDPSRWAVWLLGHLPREQVGPLIADLQEGAPEVHYAITLLWTFVENWVARRWELKPRASFDDEVT